MKGTFPIDKFQEIQTPFYYYDTNVLRQTLKTINEEAGKHEGFEVHYAVKANANPEGAQHHLPGWFRSRLCERRRNSGSHQGRFPCQQDCLCWCRQE